MKPKSKTVFPAAKYIIFLFCFLLVVPVVAFADECPQGEICNPAPGQLVSITDFGGLAARVIQILLATAGAVAVVFLIIGGFRYVTAQGNEEGMEKAKKTVTGAIIGIVIIVLAYAVVAVVNNLLVTPPG